MSFEISWLCWNSAQSILRTARSFPSNVSAAASTKRVLPEPVGPKRSKFESGKPGRREPVGARRDPGPPPCGEGSLQNLEPQNFADWDPISVSCCRLSPPDLSLVILTSKTIRQIGCHTCRQRAF